MALRDNSRCSMSVSNPTLIMVRSVHGGGVVIGSRASPLAVGTAGLGGMVLPRIPCFRWWMDWVGGPSGRGIQKLFVAGGWVLIRVVPESRFMAWAGGCSGFVTLPDG